MEPNLNTQSDLQSDPVQSVTPLQPQISPVVLVPETGNIYKSLFVGLLIICVLVSGFALWKFLPKGISGIFNITITSNNPELSTSTAQVNEPQTVLVASSSDTKITQNELAADTSTTTPLNTTSTQTNQVQQINCGVDLKCMAQAQEKCQIASVVYKTDILPAKTYIEISASIKKVGDICRASTISYLKLYPQYEKSMTENDKTNWATYLNSMKSINGIPGTCDYKQTEWSLLSKFYLYLAGDKVNGSLSQAHPQNCTGSSVGSQL